MVGWRMGGAALLLAIAACGDSIAPAPDAAPDAFVDHSCGQTSDDPIPCELPPPLPPCSRTYVESGQRGCCLVNHFYPCEGGFHVD
jgi:hypothetical protein